MMVNDKKTSTRAAILSILRNSTAPVSGEAAAETVGVSRVAIWKAVQSLNESGYLISGGSSGYLLEKDRADSLYPWEFGDGERNIKHLDETGSTMDKALEAALSGCADGLVILAEKQLRGRGTGAKRWNGPEGGLFFTAVTRPVLETGRSHRQVLKAQLAMIEAVKKTTGLDAFPGWPNDILRPEGKTGGILCDTLASGNFVSFINIGIGMNTSSSVPSALSDSARQPPPSSIPSGRRELLSAFLSSFNRTDEDLTAQWNALCPVASKEIRYRIRDGGERRALFLGVDESGWAIIDDGCEQHCPPGSITLIDKGMYV
jgi:BirA family transcriptional regulator, biotin operon repressor / biotin---[acetyl-CoA-carboxylase] ligase